MIALTNRAVQEDLYKILNLKKDPYVLTGDNVGEYKLVTKTSDTSTMSYPYKTKEACYSDYNEIIRIKNLL